MKKSNDVMESKVFLIGSEKDFFVMIEKRLKQQGFELLNTLPLIARKSKKINCMQKYLMEKK
ncbi:MAG: hypothetical protein IBX60_03990 [Candidatus Aminicenantes bacterium]|nr:hypothetical protein [Candidatus Aminicenantes bacterium]